MHRIFTIAAAVTMVLVGAAEAQSRYVVVNGMLLNDDQVAQLDQAQCAYIPDGEYWLDVRTGAWGYAGIPGVQGYLGAGCRRKSLSERGQLFSTWDWVRD